MAAATYQDYRPPFLLLAVVTASLALAFSAHAQRGSVWRGYKKGEGLAESTCNSVSIGSNGKVLVTHRSGISELDGYGVRIYPVPNTAVIRVSETPSGQVWALTRTGFLELKNNGWITYPVAEIAEQFKSNEIPNELSFLFFPVKQGRVVFATRTGLMEFNAEDDSHPHVRELRACSKGNIGEFLGVCSGADEALWISGERGLAKIAGPLRSLTDSSEYREFPVPDSLHAMNFRQPFEDRDGGITCVAESSTNGQKVAVRFSGETWTVFPAGVRNITRAWRGPEGGTWAMTDDSLIEWDEERNEFRNNEDFSALRCFDVAVQSDGSFWLAASEGLYHCMAAAWNSPQIIRGITLMISSITEDPQGRLWFIGGTELHVDDGESHRSFPLPEPIARNPEATGKLFALKSGTLLLAASGQLFQFSPDRKSFSNIPSPDKVRRRNVVGVLNDGTLCVQSFTSDAVGDSYRLEMFDGRRFQVFQSQSPQHILNGNLRSVFTAQNGDLWFASERNVACLHDGKWQEFSDADKLAPANAIAFVELAGGKIWCAGADRISEFDGRDWIVVRSGLDHINAMTRTSDGSVWVATDGGLFRFLDGAWIENGLEDGLPTQFVQNLHEDRRGRLWAGTARGLVRYLSEADVDPPKVTIQKLAEKEGDIPEGGTITLAFVGRDRWKYTMNGRLLFSYRLDQHDWTPFLDANSVSYTDLPPGKHYFQVRAIDRNGNISAPTKTEFAVILLWYHETRLLVIALVGLACALFFASLSYNRHRKLVRSYAEVERKVTERTRELALANRELLHSQKMNALGTLAAGIAHDFNNILSIIKGSAQIIEDNAGNPEKIRTRVDRIKTVVEQGAGVVNAMLGFSRESDGVAALCDLNEVVADTIKLLGDRFHREVEVSFSPVENLPHVRVSKDFVQQILLNFIFNAAEAMTEKKRIVITFDRASALPDGVVLMPAQSNENICVSVQDFGCGIPPENLPRIFEPFFTTKSLSTRRGTGLGLSMVYELAKKIGAGIKVESVVNRGSTFTLILPVTEAKQT
jgi:signal transduction histidine kinase/ligand-binding sensor domain-containing protein